MKLFNIPMSNNTFSRMLLIISFFIIAAIFIPIFGLMFLLSIPVLTFYSTVIIGKIKTAVAFFIPEILVVILSHLLQLNVPYLFILVMGVTGFAIALLALTNHTVEKTVIYPVLIIIGSICVYFVYFGMTLSVNPWLVVKQFVAQTVEENINFYDHLPLDKADVKLIKDNKSLFINNFTSVFPALAVIGSTAVVWFNVLVGRDVLHKTSTALPQLSGLANWKAPEFIIWIFIISGGILFIPNKTIWFISLNIFLIICFIYLLQGFAIISYFFQNKNIPVFLRYLFYFFIAAQQFLMIPIVVAGLFDIWINFRKLIQKKQASI